MERALLIYNPTSGRETAGPRLKTMLEELGAAGFKLDAEGTKGPGDATALASRACREFNTIIAAGGDGTLHEVVNGIGAEGPRMQLGIIPTGTSNDFARTLKLPTNVRGACKIIARRCTRLIDVGSLNDRLFINIAGGGNLTNISYEVPSKLKTYLGQLAYYFRGLEEILRLRPVRMRISTPEMTIDEEVMLFLTSNSSVVGGFERLAPNAAPDDGLLDLVVFKKVNVAEIVTLAAQCLTGEHINHAGVVYLQTREVEVTSSENVSLNADGEFAGYLPCDIRVNRQHLKIFVPEN